MKAKFEVDLAVWITVILLALMFLALTHLPQIYDFLRALGA